MFPRFSDFGALILICSLFRLWEEAMSVTRSRFFQFP
jgi:hypothetical protein